MKEPVIVTVVVGLILAMIGGVIYALWLIGREGVLVLAGVFTGGVVLAALTAASALPIRAYRKNDSPPVVEHHYHDGTRTVEKIHTLDGRMPGGGDIRLLQLPQTGAAGAFPELLRASYRAGLLAAPNGNQVDQPQSGELRELDPANPEWANEAVTTEPADRHIYAGAGEWLDWTGDVRP